MKRRSTNVQVFEGLTVLSLLLVACDAPPDLKSRPWHAGEVEVSPGLFIRIDERFASSDDGGQQTNWARLHTLGASGNFSEWVELRIKWRDTNVCWKAEATPLSLRAFEDRLFLIAFDRVSKGLDEAHFRYYAQEGTKFKEIKPASFPKQVAGQNVGFGNRYFSAGDSRRDKVRIARDIDPSDPSFRNSLTAYIWMELATGQDYKESLRRWRIDQTLLENYVRANQPIKLTEIIRGKLRK